MGDAYIHRVIRDKPDVDSVLEKEEPIGVGTAYQNVTPVVSSQSSVRPPKVIFYYNGSSSELTVRPLAGGEVKLIADGFDNILGVQNIAADRTNHVAFFSLGDFEVSPWTSKGFYRFNYDEDTGEVIGTIDLIYTATGMVSGILVDEENQKVYWGDWGVGGLIRSDYDLTNQETIVTSGSFYGMYLDKDTDSLYSVEGDWINKYDISSLPASAVLWFKEDSPAFGASTWYGWSHMGVSPTLGTMFVESDWPSLRYIDWPIAPNTPTSYPPAYSRELAQKTGVLWFAWDYDERNQLMYYHNNAPQITYRYDVSDLKMANETIMENLSAHPDYSFAHIDIIRLG